MLMKNKFLSKSVPRGTRTIWRYLGALFILFTFAIGNVLAADTELCSATLNGITTGTNTDGIAQTGCTMKWSGVDASNNIVTISSVKYYKFTGSGSYVNLILDGGEKFQANDILTVTLSGKDDSKKEVGFSLGSDSGTAHKGSASKTVTDNIVYTLTAGDIETDGSIKIFRAGYSNARYSNFSVVRSTGGSTTYTITYDCDGAESGCPANVASATALPNPLPSAPVKDGFTFDGWFTNSTKTTAAVAGATLSANATLYAKWTENAPASSDKLYFWFSKEADATAASVTNNENSFFGGTLPSGSGSVTTSITIDGKKYDVTQYSSSKTPTTTFTVPANKAGKLYAIVKSGSSGRKVQLKKGSTTIQEITWETSATAHDFNAVGPGEYTITSTGNMNWAMFAVKIYDGTFHSVSFDSDGGSAVESLSVLEGTKATKPTDPTKDNNEFAGWVVKSTGVAYDWDAIVSADVVLKATWTPAVVKHTISFNSDGGTAVEPIEVEDGQAATAPTAPKKAGYEFDKWYNGESVYDWSAAVTGDLALTAHWNKVYVAQGSSYVFEDNGTLGTAPNAITVTKDNQPNAIAANSRIDNMWLSAMSVKLENGTYSGSGDDFKGWKINTASATIKFFVENDSRVTVTVGNLSAGLKIAYTNTGSEAQDVALVAKQANDYNVKGGTMVTLTTQGGGTVTLKGIAVSEIPAKSDDATLKDLKVGDETVDGFSAGKLQYNVELPYGSTSQPKVTAEANDDKATSVVITQTLASLEDATITVTAENLTTTKTYTVHFTVAPKLGVKLINVEVPAGTHDDTDATGYFGGTGDTKNEGNSLKIGDNCYAGVVLPTGKTFQAGDVIDIHTSVVSTSGGSVIKIYADKSASTLLYNTETIGGSTAGHNYFVLPEAVNNKSSLYVVRTSDNKWNGSIDYIAVYRLMAPFIEEFKIGEAVGTINGTNIAVEVPYAADLEHLTPAVKYWANGTAQISPAIGVTDFTDPVVFTVSSGYAEDATGAYAPVTYTVTVTKEPHYVAKIGTTGYTSLAAALEHAADGEIVLLEDIDVTAQIEIAAGVSATLDLAGHKIEYTGSTTLTSGVILVHNGASLTINDSGNPDAGSIVSGDKAYAAVALTKLGDDASNPATLVVNGGALTGYYYGITGNGSRNNTVITINGGTITGTVGIAIYHPQVGTLTVNNGSLTGEDAAIEMRAGTLVINDGTFTATATEFSCNPNGSGSTTSGAAIAIAQHTTKKDIEVTINGGTFNGVKAINESNPQANDPAPQVDLGVTDGTFHGAIATVDVNNFISGGTFDNEVTADQCAEGYAPTSWTVGTETKYGVHLAGVIRGAAVNEAFGTDNIKMYTLDNGVKIYSTGSNGQLSTSSNFSTGSDVETCGGDAGKYAFTSQHMILKFPVNVNGFKIFGTGSTQRTINSVKSSATAGTGVQIKNVGVEHVGTFTGDKEQTGGKWCQYVEATFDNDNIIAKDEYVYINLTGSMYAYRIVFTEAPCIDPVINSIDATRMKVGEQATVSVDASAVGATYQWYRCDDILGANPQIIDGATAASYSFTKAAGDQFFKVVVGCNCSTATVEDVVKAEEWYEVIRTNVTGYTEWSWNGIYDNETAGPTINQAQKGLVLASYIDAPNFDKLEGNNSAYVYRKNQYPAFQGTQLKFTTEVPGMLIIDASYTDNGNTFSVNGYPMGTLPKNHAKDTIAVKAGDVTITSQGIRIWAMTFDPDFSNYALTDNKASGYTRDVTEGRYGTICLENGGVMVGATLYEVAYYGETSKKIFFDEILNGTMEAGVPYIFLPNEGADKLAVFYTDEANESAKSANGLVGYIGASENPSDAAPVPHNEGNYILNNNQYREVVYENSAYVLSHRAYIKLAAINPTEPALAPGRRRISMNVQQAEVATGMDNLYNGEQPMKVMIDGQMYILRGEKMYDATGRLVK